jgi:hypothetical protein
VRKELTTSKSNAIKGINGAVVGNHDIILKGLSISDAHFHSPALNTFQMYIDRRSYSLNSIVPSLI